MQKESYLKVQVGFYTTHLKQVAVAVDKGNLILAEVKLNFASDCIRKNIRSYLEIENLFCLKEQMLALKGLSKYYLIIIFHLIKN